VTGNPDLIDEDEDGITIAVHQHLLHPLTIAGCLTFDPLSPPAARVEGGPAGLQRLGECSFIHPRKHEHFFGVPLLDDGGDQTVRVEPNRIHTHIVPVRETRAMQRVVAELRSSLAEVFLDAGPMAATLCTGWTTRDLAAHLVIREHRPDAALGIAVPGLAGYTARVQASVAAQRYPDVVALFAAGPPIFSPFRIPVVAELADPAEFAIHREDVRRARPDWQPLPTNPVLFDVLWRRLRTIGAITTRRSPVGIRVVRTDAPGNVVLNKRQPQVILRGNPLELLLRLSGRSEVDLEIIGDDAVVQTFNGSRIHL